MVADEERAHDAVGLLEVHRHLGPEMAVEHVAGPVHQRFAEGLLVQIGQQVAQLGAVLQAAQHLAGGHHQLQQGGEGGPAVAHETDVALDVLQAEAEVLFLGAVAGQLVDAVAQPVVVVLQVPRRDEVFERLLGHGQPARVATEAVEPAQAERGLAFVVDDAERLLDLQVARMEHVGEGAAAGVLHQLDAGAEPLQQVGAGAGAHDLAVLDQRQDRHRVAAELDLLAHLVHEEGGAPAVGQLAGADQALHQVHQGTIDRGLEFVALDQLPRLDHGVGGAGVAQGVVGVDPAVEAGKAAVDEAPIFLHLARQVLGARAHQATHGGGVELGQVPPAGVRSLAAECVGAALLVAEHPGGGQQVDRRRGQQDRREVFAKPDAAVALEVAHVDLGVRDGGPTVHHGVGVDLLLGEGVAKAFVEREAVAQVVALDLLELFLELAPGHRPHRGDHVHPQPHGLAALGRRAPGLHPVHALLPGLVEAGGADVEHPGPRPPVADRKEQGLRGPGAHRRVPGRQQLPAHAQLVLEGHGGMGVKAGGAGRGARRHAAARLIGS